MHLQRITLINFKNYTEQAHELSAGINCLLGVNGAGKTNFLDAVHYLSLGKSAFPVTDAQNIRNQEDFFSILAELEREDSVYKLQCSLKRGQKKQLKCNQKIYGSIREHLGLMPVVLVSPYDLDLVRDGNEIRRKFIDNLVGQTQKETLDQMIAHNRVLQQRNAYLKSLQGHHTPDQDLIDSLNATLIPSASAMYNARKSMIAALLPVFQKHYDFLSDGKEMVEILYTSDLDDPEFENRFTSNLQRDCMLQRTELGVHRDKLEFMISGKSLRKFGSQGQIKSFIISLRLTQFEYFAEHWGFKPILLLDDIFDKLDDHRIARLLELVSSDFFGQIMLTDARPERTKSILGEIEADKKFFLVSGGKISEDSSTLTSNEGT